MRQISKLVFSFVIFLSSVVLANENESLSASLEKKNCIPSRNADGSIAGFKCFDKSTNSMPVVQGQKKMMQPQAVQQIQNLEIEQELIRK